MKVKTIGSNMTEVEAGDKVVLVSYETPVAYNDGTGFYRTDKQWSRTTSRHINKWLAGAKAKMVSQDVLDSILS